MNFLITLCKILLLLICAGVAFGSGSCSILGLVSLGANPEEDSMLVVLSLSALGLALTTLFGWFVYKLFKSLRSSGGKSP